MTSARDDAVWMARALELARRGWFSARPNPRVGCVLVRDGVLLAEGWHARAGGPHAEVVALSHLDSPAESRGATCYVTLEPCAHHGRTGPCADALVEAGVERVVYGIEDPNPSVAGRGLARLREAGITVAGPVLEDACAALNPGFLARMRSGRPRVVGKLAVSLDGAIALADGRSQWITSPAARADGQRLRAASGAVITGRGTALADNPALTVRDPRYVDQIPGQPLRVLMDRGLALDHDSQLADTSLAATHVFTESAANPRMEALIARGVRVTVLESVSPEAVLSALAALGINDVLVEAGPALGAAFMAAGMMDELVVYRSGCLLGRGAQPGFDVPAPEALELADCWRLIETRRVGPDLRAIYVPT